MSEFITGATVERWVHEDKQFLAEVRKLARREAIDFANDPDFSASMRINADKLELDDFREQGDIGLSTKLVVEHPVFGNVLCELLNVHGLFNENDPWLSDATEAFVMVFFEVLGQCLEEYENRHRGF